MYPFDNLDMQNRMYMHAKLDKIKEIYFLKTVNMNSVARKYSPLDFWTNCFRQTYMYNATRPLFAIFKILIDTLDFL